MIQVPRLLHNYALALGLYLQRSGLLTPETENAIGEAARTVAWDLERQQMQRRKPRPRSASLAAEVVRAVQSATGVRKARILGRSHLPSVARARHLTAWLLRAAGLSYPEIGAAIGRHHTSVLWAVRKVEADLELMATAGAIAMDLADAIC